MTRITCHDCRGPITDGAEVWLGADGLPDEATGEPYCPDCATPLGIAA